MTDNTKTNADADLFDYRTGDYLRPATQDEFSASEDAAKADGGNGVIVVDGRSCYAI